MSNPNPITHGARHDVTGKVCSKCGIPQPIDEFTRRRKGSDKRQGTCKSCVRKQQRDNPAKYARNLEWIQTKWREDPEWKRSRFAVIAEYRGLRRAQGTLHRGGIDRSAVFERDGYICQLCNTPIDMDAEPRSPLSPSIDHITPLVLGGAHSYDNVHAAHLFCNISKGARDAPKRKLEPKP